MVVLGVIAVSCAIGAPWTEKVVVWRIGRPFVVFLFGAGYSLVVAGLGALLAIALDRPEVLSLRP
jgi:hypothetical protein